MASAVNDKTDVEDTLRARILTLEDQQQQNQKELTRMISMQSESAMQGAQLSDEKVRLSKEKLQLQGQIAELELQLETARSARQSAVAQVAEVQTEMQAEMQAKMREALASKQRELEELVTKHAQELEALEASRITSDTATATAAAATATATAAATAAATMNAHRDHADRLTKEVALLKANVVNSYEEIDTLTKSADDLLDVQVPPSPSLLLSHSTALPLFLSIFLYFSFSPSLPPSL